MIGLNQVQPIAHGFLVTLDRLVGADCIAEDFDPQSRDSGRSGLGKDRSRRIDRIGPNPLGEGVKLRSIAEGRHTAEGGRDRLQLLQVSDILIHTTARLDTPCRDNAWTKALGGDVLRVHVEPDA